MNPVADNTDDHQRSITKAAITAIIRGSPRFPNMSAQLGNAQSTAESSFVSTVMRDRIKAALFQKAFSFKEEILEEMDDIKMQLEQDVKQMFSCINLIAEDQEAKDIATKDGNFRRADEIEIWQTENLARAQQILIKVEKHEREFAELKQKWENFRTNFKGKVIQAIQREMQKQKEIAKPGDFLDWRYFMPEIVVKDLNTRTSTATTVRVKYFE